MKNGIGKLARFCRSHRGLMVLLLVGLTISLLALAAPQAWATPDQDPLRQSPPTPTPTPEPPVGGETIAAGNSALLLPVVALVVLVACLSTTALVWRRVRV